MCFALETRRTNIMASYNGSAVLGVVYDKGVLLAADTYLTTANRLIVEREAKRIISLPYSNVLLGFTGDMADFQMTIMELEALMLEDRLNAVPPRNASDILNWLTARFYDQRTKLKPIFNSVTVAGLDENKKPILGVVNHLGVQWRNNYTGTGLGVYFSNPVLRENLVNGPLSEEKARKVMMDGLRILFRSDKTAGRVVIYAKVDATGAATVEDPIAIVPLTSNYECHQHAQVPEGLVI